MGSAAASALLRPAASTRPSQSLVSALSASASDGEAGSLQTVLLDEVAAHPDNPRESLGDLDELAASIKSLGLRQPIVVVPADRFLTANRQLTIPPTAKWVILAGHRRRAAAVLAGVQSVPAWIRPDLATREDAAETFVVENVHRASLSPLEEARVYALLTDLSGGTQRAVAQRCGVSQAHVSKRMSLLKLPQSAQDALAEGSFAVTDALALVAVESGDQLAVFELARARNWPIPTAAQTIDERRRRSARVDDAHARAATEGLEVVRESQSRWQPVTDSAAIDTARVAGALRASISGDGTFSYVIPAEIEKTDTDDDGAEVADRIAKLRSEAQHFIDQRPSHRKLAALLAEGLLAGAVLTPRVRARAADWFGNSVGITPATNGGPSIGNSDRITAAAAGVLAAAIDARVDSPLHQVAARTLAGGGTR
jgi:ParB/RepB/Spo0J family partition protein